MIKFFNKIIRNEKIIEKYASGSLHFIFPPFHYGKITLAQHSIYGSLVALRSPIFCSTAPACRQIGSAKHRIY